MAHFRKKVFDESIFEWNVLPTSLSLQNASLSILITFCKTTTSRWWEKNDRGTILQQRAWRHRGALCIIGETHILVGVEAPPPPWHRSRLAGPWRHLVEGDEQPIGPTVKQVWNDAIHVLHTFGGGAAKNTTGYHLGRLNLHLLLLKSSMASPSKRRLSSSIVYCQLIKKHTDVQNG